MLLDSKQQGRIMNNLRMLWIGSQLRVKRGFDVVLRCTGRALISGTFLRVWSPYDR